MRIRALVCRLDDDKPDDNGNIFPTSLINKINILPDTPITINYNKEKLIGKVISSEKKDGTDIYIEAEIDAALLPCEKFVFRPMYDVPMGGITENKNSTRTITGVTSIPEITATDQPSDNYDFEYEILPENI